MDTSVGRKTNVTDFSTAYYLLEGLKEIGIEYLFCNLGTDHAPIIEEMAHRRQRGEAMPKSCAVRMRTPPCTWRPATRW